MVARNCVPPRAHTPIFAGHRPLIYRQGPVQIEPKANYHGFTMLQARNVVRRFPPAGSSCFFGWGCACSVLQSEKDGLALVEALERDGYLIRPKDEGAIFQRTDSGNQLALASARPLKRATADRMLRELLQRARKINRSSTYCYRVGALIVFGSYLDKSRDRLGDLDVGFVMSPRFASGTRESEAAETRSRERARRAHRTFGCFQDWIGWPEREFLLALKARTQGLSLHNYKGIDGKVIQAAPHRLVFGELPRG